MAAETGFTINGEIVDRPALDKLKMKERRLLYDLAGFVQEDFIQREDENDDEHTARVDKMTGHPGFQEALMHIAYSREHPELSRARVQEIVDETDWLTALSSLTVEDDAGPPALTNEPGEQSETRSDSRSDSSGAPLTNGSDELAAVPTSIGTTRSVTSST